MIYSELQDFLIYKTNLKFGYLLKFIVQMITREELLSRNIITEAVFTHQHEKQMLSSTVLVTAPYGDDKMPR